MKNQVRYILILLIFQSVVIPGQKLNGNPDETGNLTFSPGFTADTITPNPYLKIRKFELDIISPSAGIQFFKDGILFLSLSKKNTRMLSKHVSFGDRQLYYALPGDSTVINPTPLKTENELLVPAEGTTFTGDMSVGYFSILSENDNRIKIHRAEPVDNTDPLTWKISMTPLGFCHDYNNYTHPTVSTDGKIMIFSSDMPGGAGQMDLYVSRYENNVWSRPENLGTGFNSPGSELYAFLDNANNLFFSSDGLPGLGGFDIFFSSFDGNGWTHPVNLYDQVNTINDDIALIINRQDKNYGFYTVIKRSGITKKNLDRQLYRIELKDEYKNDESLFLSGILEAYALEAPVIALYTDEGEAVQPAEAEPAADPKAAEEKWIADSLLAVQKETEKLAEEQRIADSLLAAQIEDERLAEEKRLADSLRMEEIKREEEAEKESVIYRVQILASTRKGVEYNVKVGGRTYDTYEYFYEGAWRITVGEFTGLSEAVEFRKACREAGYEQAFVVAFKDGIRSLDPDLFR